MKSAVAILAASLVLVTGSTGRAAGTLYFAVMSPGDAEKERPRYEALSAYLRAVNPLLGDLKIRIAKDFPEAARLFRDGEVDGMFSGSFVAAVFIAKGIARPVARPLGANGASTYGTSIVAKEGTPSFGGVGDFRGKRVAYTPLASAGEIYLRSLAGPGVKLQDICTPVPVESHHAALDAVAGGAADYAVVKSTVFVAGEHPGLALVGTGPAGHPDNTLIMTPSVYDRFAALFSKALLGLGSDTSAAAEEARRTMGCTTFVATSGMDFSPTFTLVKKAGIEPKTFDFSF